MAPSLMPRSNLIHQKLTCSEYDYLREIVAKRRGIDDVENVLWCPSQADPDYFSFHEQSIYRLESKQMTA
jgi:hypothetical protein